MLPANPRLVRRAAIRRLLTGRYGFNGIKTIAQLMSELAQPPFNIRTSLSTLSADLKSMGAWRVRDPMVPGMEWLGLAPFNPGIEDARTQLDPEVIERELAYKIQGHAYDVVPLGRFIYVMTEPMAGHIVAYWLSLLSWPEILIVQEGLNSAVMHCITVEAAISVAERLVGYREDVSEGEEDRPDEEAEGDGSSDDEVGAGAGTGGGDDQ